MVAFRPSRSPLSRSVCRSLRVPSCWWGRWWQPAGSAAVTVVEHGDAAGVVSRESQSNDRIRFKGYRIGIFFDNGAEARANALAAKQTFETAFPDIPVYLVYENPYFKVSAGNCVTSEEAIVLLGKIRSQFPEAYLMREDLTVADLIR